MSEVIYGRRIHPACAATPEMEPEQYAALKDSLDREGQFLPIIEGPDGRILDGRHRLLALEELGREPWVERYCDVLGVEVRQADLDEGNGRAYATMAVIALNKHRRHLTPGDLAKVAADVYEASRRDGAPVTQAAAAEKVGANTRGVEREIAKRKGAERDVVVDGEVVHRATSKKKARVLQGLFDRGLAKPADLDALLGLPLAALEDALARGVALPVAPAATSLFRINPDEKTPQQVREADFATLGYRERYDIQEWIAANPSILGDDLLIIAKEYDRFDWTKERLDLLAVGQDGNLVIIELKRDDTGADVHWQAIKYASYLSHAAPAQIVGMLADYAEISKEEAEEKLLRHLDAGDLGSLNRSQRIIIASHRFAREVTSAVLWINERMDGDVITCIQLMPYQDGGSLYLQANTLIPVPGTEGYRIGIGDRNLDLQPAAATPTLPR